MSTRHRRLTANLSPNTRRVSWSPIRTSKTNLPRCTISPNQCDAESSAVADAKRAEEIANNRYNTGLVSYPDVVFAEQTLLANQEITTQVQGQRMMTTVALIRALGGSWNN